jgi:hypothetical protein
MSSMDHLTILPKASGFQIISPNGNDETTVTGWALK